MSALSRYALLATALALLGACDLVFVHHSDLTAVQIEHLSGTWAGEATINGATSYRSCPQGYLWTLHAANGNVAGSFVDKTTPKAPPATFTTFIDYDGSVHADVRTSGNDFFLLGTFNHDGFRGSVRTTGCYYVISLDRQGAAS